MTLKQSALCFLSILIVCTAEDGSLDDLINKVFGTTNRPGTIPPDTIPINPGNNPGYENPDLNPGGQTGGGNDNEYPPFKPGDGIDTGLGGDQCTCVPYYLCANDSIITDGTGVIDIRFGNGNPCTTSVDVCCGKSISREPNEPITPKPKGRLGCGKRNTDGVGFRITGNVNNEAQFGEFPWMVAILKEEVINEETLSLYKCGGALIHENVVLTAAHCVAKESPRALKARFGEWDTQTTDELFPHQDRYVSEVVIHENYYAGALFNDVALLILAEPVKFADNIDIICLPEQDEVVIDDSCWASGWGKDVFGKEGQYQVILKRVELPMVPRDRCQDELRKTRLGPRFRLHESFVCAGGIKGRDTCKGDGGSPLICPIKGRRYQYQQVGIVAWGIGCGNETPAAYVNVAKFRHWIDHHLSQHNFRTEYKY